jgi:hypothetical protein
VVLGGIFEENKKDQYAWSFLFGGERGIRTLGTVAGSLVFETSQFNHSCTSPVWSLVIVTDWLAALRQLFFEIYHICSIYNIRDITHKKLSQNRPQGTSILRKNMLHLPLLLFHPEQGRVAQLDRALACGAKGRRFESCRVHQDEYRKTAITAVFCCSKKVVHARGAGFLNLILALSARRPFLGLLSPHFSFAQALKGLFEGHKHSKI